MSRLFIVRIILETPRLMLRELTWDDFDFFAMMWADPLVMRYYPEPSTDDESKERLERVLNCYEKFGYSLWLVASRNRGEPIGQVGLLPKVVDGAEEAEIAYLIHHPFWRQGYATEAAAAVRDYAFNTLGKQRVISLVRPINVPSQRVALRIGLKPEKLTIHHELEHLVFSLSRPGA